MTMSQKSAWWILALSLLITVVRLLPNSMIIRPGPEAGFYPIPKVQVHPFKAKSGLMVLVPDHGDQCWDAHLMCAPYPDLNLRLRNDANITQGFAVLNK